MPKVDFKKKFKHLYSASSMVFEIVDVPVMKYLMIDGHGDPNTSAEYEDALKTIYPVAYKLKFASKSKNFDYVVPPLEGLWWSDDMSSFVSREKDKWDWTIMIMTPQWISQADVSAVVSDLKASNKAPAIEKLRFEELDEGLCAQILHIGSYDDEAPTLAYLHDEWLPQNGFVENGKHHEIYISDPRKTSSDSLKTILRQPIVVAK